MVVGHYLFRIAGGITFHPEEPVFTTHFGGINWAFETPLYVPGSYLMSQSNVGPCMWEGTKFHLFLFLATTLTALATAQVIQKIANKEQNKFGKFYWRFAIILAGWVFIPVPVEMTMAYQFTVLC